VILFKPDHVEPILAGRKVETRRIWKKQRVLVGSIQLAKTKLISKDYFARLHILDVRKESLGCILYDEESARAEGYKSSIEFLCAFANINLKCNPPARNEDDLAELSKECDFMSQEVYVVRFEVVA
jgi:hypothetical protein